MTLNEKPATGAGLPVVLLSGEDKQQRSQRTPKTQASWDRARDLERDSRSRALAALTMRGAERLQALAVASALAFAARDAGLMAGGVQ